MKKGGKPLKPSICNFVYTKINYVWFKTHKLLNKNPEIKKLKKSV